MVIILFVIIVEVKISCSEKIYEIIAFQFEIIATQCENVATQCGNVATQCENPVLTMEVN